MTFELIDNYLPNLISN